MPSKKKRGKQAAAAAAVPQKKDKTAEANLPGNWEAAASNLGGRLGDKSLVDEQLVLELLAKPSSAATVRARRGRLIALSVSLCKPVFYGDFVWERRALNSQKRRFPVRADAEPEEGDNIARLRSVLSALDANRVVLRAQVLSWPHP